MSVHDEAGWVGSSPSSSARPEGAGPAAATRTLHDGHRRMLVDESGISPEVVEARGYWTATQPADLEAIGFKGGQLTVPGLVIPIRGPSGEVVAHSYRPDRPRLREGKAVKYEWPVGNPPRLDVPTAVLPVLGDPNSPLWFTEGSKKADAAVSRGVMCIALIGVWNWRGKNAQGGSTAIGDFEQIALKGRTIFLAFDSDVTTKQSVRQALLRFKGFLESRGAKAVILQIPSQTGEKVGLDDYLAAGGDVTTLVSGATGLPTTQSDESKADRGLAARLIALVEKAGVELWHDEENVGHATCPRDDHVEHYRIDSTAFELYCGHLWHSETGRGMPASAWSEVKVTLQAKARYEGLQHPTGLRLGHHDGRIYLFLADRAWQVVEISAGGWSTISAASCPVRFIKKNSGALPEPEVCDDIHRLKPFLSVDDDGFTLVVAFLVGCFLPEGTFPILVGTGEQGSGKSFGCSLIRSLVDPSQANCRRPPRDVESLAVAVANCEVLAFDNVSVVQDWLSDALCSVTTGTGFTSRALYTNSEEHIVAARRPVILNGIDDFLRRPDLAERALVLHFKRFSSGERKEERVLKRELGLALPSILGALLGRVVRALATRDQIELDELPRLADLARFVTASEPDDERGAFLRVLRRGSAEQSASMIEGDSFGDALRSWIDAKGEATVAAGELNQLLIASAGLDASKKLPAGWPSGAKGTADHLRRIAPLLRELGYEIEQLPRSRRKRAWVIRAPRDADLALPASPTSPASQAATLDVGNLPYDDVRAGEPTLADSSASSEGQRPAPHFEPLRDDDDACDEPEGNLFEVSLSADHGRCEGTL